MPTVEELLEAIRHRREAGPRQPTWRILHQLADARAIRIREEFLRAVSRTNGATRIETVEAALRAGNLEAAERAIPWDEIGVRLLNATLREELRELVIEAGVAAEKLQPAGLNLRFDLRNPFATEAAAEHAAEAVTQVSAGTKEAIRDTIARALNEGRTPATAAREIRDVIGLHTRQASALAKLRAEMDARGMPDAWVERAIARESRKALNERANVIAHHETMRAANAGQQELWRQAGETKLVEPATARREFVVTPDSRLCPICRPLDGQTYGLEEPIVSEAGTALAPPIHVRCRCTMVLVVG